MNRILVVDDKAGIRKFLRIILENDGFVVDDAEDGEDALRCVENQKPSLIITDQRMPKVSGMELLEELSVRYPEIPVIIITAYSSSNEAVQALQLGAVNYIRKPIEIPQLKAAISTAFSKAPESTSEPLNFFFGTSRLSQEAKSACEAALLANSSILIRGEPGTRREQLARELQLKLSSHRLILDVDKKLEDNERIDLSTTMITTSSKSLRELVDTEICSSEIYTSLSEVLIYLPSIREDKENLLQYCAEFLKPTKKKLGSAAQAKLMEYSFPNNYTELHGVLERASRMTSSEIIAPEAILFSDFSTDERRLCRNNALLHCETIDEIYTTGYENFLIQCECQILREALSKTSSVTEAAEKLGLSFRALRYKVKKWNLKPGK